MRTKFAVYFLALLVLIGCAPRRSAAQFIGYTSPQTVQASLASALACTGGVQNFTTGVTPGFPNLGQTVHTAVVTPAAGITSLSVQIFGIDNAGNSLAISDQAFSNLGLSAIINGTGYFPQIKLTVVCNVGGTFNLTYSGASSTALVNAATPLQSQITKVIALNLNSGSGFTPGSFTTPFGNSSGMLFYTTVTAAGGAPTVAVSCAGGTPLQSFNVTFSPVSGNNLTQGFPIPASPCLNMIITYTPNGAAGANNLSIGVSFNSPGLPLFAADPCQSPLNTKTSAVVTAAAAATTQIIPNVAGQIIYVCGYQISQAVLAGTVQWTTGSGATCGTATVAKTGAMQTIVGQPFTYNGPGMIFSAAPGANVCLTTTGAGATAAGIITFVQL